MLRVKSDRRACTMIMPAQVYDQAREVSRRTGIPLNRIATLALDFWLTTYYAGSRLARAFTDPAIAYDESGAARSLDEIAQLASGESGKQTG